MHEPFRFKAFPRRTRIGVQSTQAVEKRRSIAVQRVTIGCGLCFAGAVCNLTMTHTITRRAFVSRAAVALAAIPASQWHLNEWRPSSPLRIGVLSPEARDAASLAALGRQLGVDEAEWPDRYAVRDRCCVVYGAGEHSSRETTVGSRDQPRWPVRLHSERAIERRFGAGHDDESGRGNDQGGAAAVGNSAIEPRFHSAYARGEISDGLISLRPPQNTFV